MILRPRRKVRRRYPDTIVVRTDAKKPWLEAKVVWGETDIKSIVARLPRVQPDAAPETQGDQASA